jgi:uncharacterized membrane protein (UPF0127 family)
MTSPWRLVRRDTGQAVVERLEIAGNMWTRFWGLQFRAGLSSGSGLLLVPCPSVHTFFMRFAIDVLLLDRQGKVVAVRRGVRPWRVVLPVSDSYATLELPGGTTDLDVGVCLSLDGEERTAPRWLRFLCPSRPV